MALSRKEKGFTLIELLTVIAILTVLIGIATFSFRDVRLRSALKGGVQSLESDILWARTAAKTRQERVSVNLEVGAEKEYTINLVRGNRLMRSGRIYNGVNILSVTPNTSFIFNGTGMTENETTIVLNRVDAASTGIIDQYRLRLSITGIVLVERSLDGGSTWSRAW